ncbi:MAG: hypothetical protein NWQ53_03595 [Flavobacteriales bacterium]|nr:hypothetical protein [Flavobacteriaceae bacterium]MDP4952705.1 hypothetical protein [Flavobacteriales bacterium]
METKNKENEKKPNKAFTVSGDWGKQSRALKEKYPTLTSEDVKFQTGEESGLMKRMETRLHKNREEVIGILQTNQKACC